MEDKQIPLSKLKSLAEKNIHVSISFAQEVKESPLLCHLAFYDSGLSSVYVVVDPEPTSTHYQVRVISLKSIDNVKDISSVPSLFKPTDFLKKLAQGGSDEFWEERAKAQQKKISAEASTQARFIFHTLQKGQYKCVWEKGVNIVIPDANVTISPPYVPESCSGPRGAVSRIKTVVGGDLVLASKNKG